MTNLFVVIDDVLMHRNADGMSSSSQIRSMRSNGIGISGIIFLHWPIIRTSLNNLGLKFILKNVHLYFLLVCVWYGRIGLDLLRNIKK